MRTTCLVNHHNYARYVGEALESALAQTVPFDEIIVVDDGSNDADVAVLRDLCAASPRIRLIEQENEGQLSCFNVGFEASTGDVIFFLDADDVFEPEYVYEVLALHETRPDVGFVFCNQRELGSNGERAAEIEPDRDYGRTALLTRHLRKWIGSSTSCLSLRRSALEAILPLPFLDDWKIRADDCLVFGASLTGARKVYVGRPLVQRRLHGENRHEGRELDAAQRAHHVEAIDRLIDHWAPSGDDDVASVRSAPAEFASVGRPTMRDFRRYLSIVRRLDAPFLTKLRAVSALTWHGLFGRFRASARRATPER